MESRLYAFVVQAIPANSLSFSHFLAQDALALDSHRYSCMLTIQRAKIAHGEASRPCEERMEYLLSAPAYGNFDATPLPKSTGGNGDFHLVICSAARLAERQRHQTTLTWSPSHGQYVANQTRRSPSNDSAKMCSNQVYSIQAAHDNANQTGDFKQIACAGNPSSAQIITH